MRAIRIGATVLALLAILPKVAASKQPPPQCTTQTQGSVVTSTLSTHSKGKRPVLLDQASSTDTASGSISFEIAVTQGQQQVIHLTQTVAAGGSGSGDVRFGSGFKGVAESSFTTDGTTAVVVIDGKRTQPFRLGAAASSIRFEDGSPLPRIRVRSSIRKTLLKLAARARTGCPVPAGAVLAQVAATSLVVPRVASDPILQGSHASLPDDSFDCVACQGKCSSAWLACCAATFSNPVGAAVAIGSALAGKKTCFELSEDCLKACHEGGGACCPVKCGESCLAVGTVCCQPEPSGFVPACAPGSKCATSKSLSGDLQVCCPPEAGEGCGPGCCRPGDHCTNAACCPAGSGDYCGRLGCCGDGQQCHVSYDSESGDELGRVCCDHDPCGDNTCCPSDSVCIAPDMCCKKTDICPGSGFCCPPPGVCLADGECCPAGAQCGNTCCPLGGCCNGQCCGAGEVCVAGACCPVNRQCGATCCPDGYACTDPDTGSCAPCGPGESACPYGTTDPMCCPTGQDCCATGACCAVGLQCCSTGGVVGCFQPFECVH